VAKATTEAVFQHHIQTMSSDNLDEALKDYTEDSVLFTPIAMYTGLDAIKAGFTAMTKLHPVVAANFKIIRQEIQGEYIYFLWSALPSIPFAGDTFYIHNGKILMQSVFFPTGR
jgi:ketosteroid isomerase-like protein